MTDSHHQKLMNKAYKRWQDGDLQGLSYSAFVLNLKDDRRAAVLLGNYNYQVENGGHSQWVFNRYVKPKTFTLLIMALTQMAQNGYGLAKKVMLFAQEAYHIQNRERGEGDLSGEEYDLLDSLDDQYYDIQDDFMVQCEFFLKELSNLKITEEELIAYERALNAK